MKNISELLRNARFVMRGPWAEDERKMIGSKVFFVTRVETKTTVATIRAEIQSRVIKTLDEYRACGYRPVCSARFNKVA